MDPLPQPEPNEREDIRLRPVEGWNPAVVEQLLAVVRQALAEAPSPSETPFVESPNDGPKPALNITRILQRAEQDLAASEKLVEDQARLTVQTDADATIAQRIATADAKLVAAVQRLLTLGARPEVVSEAIAGLLSGK